MDISVWIGHLRAGLPSLVERLEADEVGSHPLVIEEPALGGVRSREQVLRALGELPSFPWISHREALALVDGQRLWSTGLSAVDVRFLGSALIHPGGRIWTGDRRLREVATRLGVRAEDP